MGPGAGRIQDPVTRPAAARRNHLLFGAVVLILAVVTFETVMTIPVHHDIGWPLYVAERVLSGAVLYVDVVEVHPPLVIAVALAAVLLARTFSLSPILAYHIIALSAVLMSLALSWRILSRPAADDADNALPPIVLIAVAFFLLPFVGYSFGQEEHFMLVLVLPYLFALGAVAEGDDIRTLTRLTTAILAGIGFSMKPLYGPVWLALAGYLVWTNGARALRRIEVVVPAFIMVLYIAITLIFTPGYFPLVRLTSAVYFDYFPSPMRAVVLSVGTLAAAAAVVIHFAGSVGARRTHRRTIFLIALVGFVIVVLVQHKGWSYHWYPVYAVAALLVLLAIMERARVNGPRGLVAAAAVLALGLGAWRLSWTKTFWGELAGSPYHLPAMKGVVEQYGDGGPIVALSTIMPPAFPLVNYTGVEWASRFSCLWMLPGIYADVVRRGDGFPYHELRSLSPIERYLIDAVAEDLLAGKPTLIIVDQAPPAPHLAGFDYVAYFSRDARIRSFLTDYVVIGTAGRYQVLKRIAG